MKTHHIICGLLIIAVGSFLGTLGTTDQSEAIAVTAVNELAAEKEVAVEEVASVQQVAPRGEYLEVRNARLWAGPSVANSEIEMAGDKAILAWKVRQGFHQGARLDGLAVIAVVVADRNLGVGEKVNTRTTFLVDARASESQRAALVDMAKALAGETIQDVAAIRPVKIDMNVCRGCAIGHASLEADTVKIRTRRTRDSDKADLGRLEMAHPVLSNLYYQRSAFIQEYSYSGRDLEDNAIRFTEKDVRGAVVGGFWL